MKRSKEGPGRLVILARGSENYGVATELLNFAEAFREREWQVTLYALGTGEFVDRMAAIPGVCIEMDPTVPRRFVAGGSRLKAYLRLLRGSAAFVRRLRRFLAADAPDAMIFCEHGLVLPIAAAILRLPTPVFWLMPNVISGDYPGDINRRLYAAAFAASRMVPVANSGHTRATLGRAADYATQIDLGVAPAPFLGDAAPDPLAGIVPEGALRLAVIARLTPMKGQLLLLEALLATPEAEAAHLILCGGPSGTAFEAELRQCAERAGQAHRLHLIGPVDRSAPYFAHADVVANPRIDAEPFGLSVVEAMLSAKPVVAHALGGPGDIIVDGETGWLMSDMRPESVRAALRRMIADRARWAAMGAAGRRRALDRYTVETMTDQLLQVFGQHGVAGATAGVQRN